MKAISVLWARTSLYLEKIALSAGVNLVHIPYRGGAPALNDLLGGHVGAYGVQTWGALYAAIVEPSAWLVAIVGLMTAVCHLYQALDADTHLPPGAFQDQIVLVGRDIQASVDAGAAQADLFLTPFTAQTRGLTPGVEIHASDDPCTRPNLSPSS